MGEFLLSVSGQAICRIISWQEGFCVLPLEQEVQLNGKPLRSITVLQPGDCITSGACRLCWCPPHSSTASVKQTPPEQSPLEEYSVTAVQTPALSTPSPGREQVPMSAPVACFDSPPPAPSATPPVANRPSRPPDYPVVPAHASNNPTELFSPSSQANLSVPPAHILLNIGGQQIDFKITEKHVVIGSAPDCDLVIAHPDVAAHHASICYDGEHFFLTDLGGEVRANSPRTTKLAPQTFFTLGPYLGWFDVDLVCHWDKKARRFFRQHRLRLGELLLSLHMIDQVSLEQALRMQNRTGRKLGEILVMQGKITPLQLNKLLHRQQYFYQNFLARCRRRNWLLIIVLISLVLLSLLATFWHL